MAQNRSNSKAMTDAVRNIPRHAFNDHSKCGCTWCGCTWCLFKTRKTIIIK